MKLNWAERWVVNNPSRVMQQQLEIKMMRRMMPMPPGAKILEVGCGRGAGARFIRKAFRPAQLHILDIDIQMIQKAAIYLSPHERKQISLSVGDATRLPFKSASLDALFGFGFLHHVLDWRAALYEVSRVLKKGGYYYIEELYPSLYQNVITKRILLHPTYDRFESHDLREALDRMNLILEEAFDVKFVGILGVAAKSQH